jgi:hypothetical protein
MAESRRASGFSRCAEKRSAGVQPAALCALCGRLGVYTFTMALLMVELAVTAALVTWYALKWAGRPSWIAELSARRELPQPIPKGGQW